MHAGYIAEKSLGYQQLTSLAAAASLTIPAGTVMALIQTESQSVRWRDDGTDPTATIGMQLLVGQELCYTAAQLSRMKFIEVAASAKLNVTYYG